MFYKWIFTSFIDQLLCYVSWRLLVTKKDRGGACAAILWLPLICTSDVLGVKIKPLVMMTVLRKGLVLSVMDSLTFRGKSFLLQHINCARRRKQVLVSLENVTVIASIEDKEPTFHSSPSTSQPSAHAQSEASGSSTSFVTSDRLKQISDQWSEQFARFEALLSRGNVFSAPKSTVKPVLTHTVVSDTPFIPPHARLTGPVDAPAEGEVGLAQDTTVSGTDPKDAKEKKKPRKSHKESRDKDRDSKKRQVSPSPEVRSTNRPEVKPTQVYHKPPAQAQANSGPEVVRPVQTKSMPVHTVTSQFYSTRLFSTWCYWSRGSSSWLCRSEFTFYFFV